MILHPWFEPRWGHIPQLTCTVSGFRRVNLDIMAMGLLILT